MTTQQQVTDDMNEDDNKEKDEPLALFHFGPYISSEPICCVGCSIDGIFPENRDGDTMCPSCQEDDDDVFCVGCDEIVCGFHEEPPHKDERGVVLCHDCWYSKQYEDEEEEDFWTADGGIVEFITAKLSDMEDGSYQEWGWMVDFTDKRTVAKET